MVRYIKDGAYTIVVDDVDGEENEDGNAAHDEGSINADGKSTAPSVKKESRIKSKREIEDKLEKIDYTNPEFILQNLSLALPKFEEDTTYTLVARQEVVSIIADQICFYVYCLLQVHVYKPELPTILIFGDGFVGCHVINKLAEMGCQPLLRIYSRGEYGMNEWKERGFQSSCNLLQLMTNQKADIIIICSEYSSFQLIYHMVRDCELVTDTTAIITSTLGFQRKKMYYNFGVPSVFRTYVEPQQTVRQLQLDDHEKKIAKIADNPSSIPEPGSAKAPARQTLRYKIEQLLEEEKRKEEEEALALGGMEPPAVLSANQSFTRSQMTDSTSQQTLNNPPSIQTGQQTPSVRKDSASQQEQQVDSSQADDASVSQSQTEEDLDESSVDTNSLGGESISNIDINRLSLSEKGALYILRRTPDIKYFVFLLENYYALHEILPEDARFLALRTIFGYVDSTKREIQLLPQSQQQNKRPRRGLQLDPLMVKHVEKVLLNIFSSVGHSFQRIFSKALTMSDLIGLTDRMLLAQQLDDLTKGLSTLHSVKAGLSGQSTRPGTTSRPGTTESSDGVNWTGVSQRQSQYLHQVENQRRDMYVDTKGRHHVLDAQQLSKLKYLRMHDYNSINEILQVDEDYANQTGPGFEFMKVLDSRENRKVSMSTLLKQQDLGYLYKQVTNQRDGVQVSSFDESNYISMPAVATTESNLNGTDPAISDEFKSPVNLTVNTAAQNPNPTQVFGTPMNDSVASSNPQTPLNDDEKPGTPEDHINSRKKRYEKFKQNLKTMNNTPPSTAPSANNSAPSSAPAPTPKNTDKK